MVRGAFTWALLFLLFSSSNAAHDCHPENDPETFTSGNAAFSAFSNDVQSQTIEISQDDYKNELKCFWLIKNELSDCATPSIVINVTQIDIEEWYDHLFILEGDYVVDKYDGMRAGVSVVEGPEARLLFATDIATSGDAHLGFTLEWKFECSSNKPPPCPTETQSLTMDKDSMEGVIHWPLASINNQKCTWEAKNSFTLMKNAKGEICKDLRVELDLEIFNAQLMESIDVWDGADGDRSLVNIRGEDFAYAVEMDPIYRRTSGDTLTIQIQTNKKKSNIRRGDGGMTATYRAVCGDDMSPIEEHCASVDRPILMGAGPGLLRFNYGDFRHTASVDCGWLFSFAEVDTANIPELKGCDDPRIMLNFTYFDTEENYDYVKVYDGTSVQEEEGPTGERTTIETLLASLGLVDVENKLSGNLFGQPSIKLSAGEAMLLTFHADEDGHHPAHGFEVMFTPTCGQADICSRALEMDAAGTLVFPPKSFVPVDVTCGWLFNVTDVENVVDSNGVLCEDKRIGLNFTAFSTEHMYDKVTLFDGPDVGAPLIGQYSGLDISNGPGMVVSQGSTLFMEFTADASGTDYDGFVAVFETICAEKGTCPSDLVKGPQPGSAGISNKDYKDEQHCVFEFVHPKGTPMPDGTVCEDPRTKLTFDVFDLDEPFDYVEIFDVVPLHEHMNYCVTDDENRCNILNEYPCKPWTGSVLGQLTSSDPVVTPMGRGIVKAVEMTDYYVEFEDGALVKFPRKEVHFVHSLGVFTGTHVPEEIVSLSGSIFVEFHTNEHKSGYSGHQGFRVRHEPICGENIQYDVSCPPLGSPKILNHQFNDTLNSLTFAGQDYRAGLDCAWLLENNIDNADCEHPVVVAEFTSLFTGMARSKGRFDGVTIYDGEDRTADYRLGDWAGALPQTTGKRSVVSTGKNMLVTFHSEKSPELKRHPSEGFSLDYKFICKDEAPPKNCHDPRRPLNVAKNQIINMTNLHYEDEVHCGWHIQNKKTCDNGKPVIEMDFTQFNTETLFDFVDIWAGKDSTGEKIGSYSGNEPWTTPMLLRTEVSEIYMEFSSDASVSTAHGFHGFVADVRMVCSNAPVPESEYDCSANENKLYIHLSSTTEGPIMAPEINLRPLEQYGIQSQHPDVRNSTVMKELTYGHHTIPFDVGFPFGLDHEFKGVQESALLSSYPEGLEEVLVFAPGYSLLYPECTSPQVDEAGAEALTFMCANEVLFDPFQVETIPEEGVDIVFDFTASPRSPVSALTLNSGSESLEDNDEDESDEGAIQNAEFWYTLDVKVSLEDSEWLPLNLKPRRGEADTKLLLSGNKITAAGLHTELEWDPVYLTGVKMTIKSPENFTLYGLEFFEPAIGECCDPSTDWLGASPKDKIAVCKRGDCLFVEKFRSSQAAQAKAVVIVNTVETPVRMVSAEGAFVEDITIPGIMVLQSYGQMLLHASLDHEMKLKLALYNCDTFDPTKTLSPTVTPPTTWRPTRIGVRVTRAPTPIPAITDAPTTFPTYNTKPPPTDHRDRGGDSMCCSPSGFLTYAENSVCVNFADSASKVMMTFQAWSPLATKEVSEKLSEAVDWPLPGPDQPFGIVVNILSHDRPTFNTGVYVWPDVVGQRPPSLGVGSIVSLMNDPSDAFNLARSMGVLFVQSLTADGVTYYNSEAGQIKISTILNLNLASSRRKILSDLAKVLEWPEHLCDIEVESASTRRQLETEGENVFQKVLTNKDGTKVIQTIKRTIVDGDTKNDILSERAIEAVEPTICTAYIYNDYVRDTRADLSKYERRVADSKCNAGDTKDVECNKCKCLEGRWACQEKDCDAVSNVGDECNLGGTKQLECNKCSCLEGRWACQKNNCNDNINIVEVTKQTGDIPKEEEPSSLPAPVPIEDTSLNGGVIAIIVILVFAVIGAIGYYCWFINKGGKPSRKSSVKHQRIPSVELDLGGEESVTLHDQGHEHVGGRASLIPAGPEMAEPGRYDQLNFENSTSSPSNISRQEGESAAAIMSTDDVKLKMPKGTDESEESDDNDDDDDDSSVSSTGNGDTNL